MPALQVHEPPPPGPWRPPRALLAVNVWTALLDDALVDFSRVQGHQQVTDLYLLASPPLKPRRSPNRFTLA